MKKVNKRAGKIISVAVADMVPHNIPSSVIAYAAAIGAVKACRDVRNSANTKSFHDNKKLNIAVATTPGAVRGTVMRHIMPKGPQPSIFAASSNSRGNSSKNALRRKMHNGILKPE